MYYHRQMERKLLELSGEFACITLYGARQTGKSTMVRHLFPQYEYITLDNSRERTLASDDPELFLDSHGTPLIIDEIQKVPELMESIKIRIDEANLKRVQHRRHWPGGLRSWKFILFPSAKRGKKKGMSSFPMSISLSKSRQRSFPVTGLRSLKRSIWAECPNTGRSGLTATLFLRVIFLRIWKRMSAA